VLKAAMFLVSSAIGSEVTYTDKINRTDIM